MPTSLSEDLTNKKLELPFLIELTRNVILRALQEQVETPIDPASLAFDSQGFVWDDGDIVLDVTFKNLKGFGQGRIIVQPATNDALDVCFLADVKFLGYLPSAGSS